ncbi:MAG TPA: right-handed parallel beta-helix repeat-containing protein [Sphingobacteriaceae bacterium]|nr:right-handed parallel beta-helix repeat-containing protein [Sphingobacteriaceae bacterium]
MKKLLRKYKQIIVFILLLNSGPVAFSQTPAGTPLLRPARDNSFTEISRSNLFVGVPKTISTFETISLELPFKGDGNRDAYCDVKFRKKGDANWRDGLRLFNDYITDEKGFRGSIVLLQPDTDYDIRLIYNDVDGGSGEKTMSAKTWSERFPVGKLTKVKNRKTTIKVESGSPGAYHVYDGGSKKALVDANNTPYCIDLGGASYVIIRNLKLTGSDKHAINIQNANHIVIEDCEIFEWGRPGEYCQIDNRGRRDGAVYVETSKQIVVQHNNIHDPRGNTCDWRIAHPNGPRGIYLNDTVDNSVFRYNKIAGSEKHYYDDLITGDTDGSGSDLDIYGNIISHAWDDGIEIEGKNKNIRVWNNVVRHVFQGLASDNNTHMYYGPAYIWRNIFTDLYSKPANPGEKSTGNGFKLENTAALGGMYIFNNTFLNHGVHVRPNGGISNGPQYNLTVLNNIFDIEKDNFHADLVRTGSMFNYNGYAGSNKLFEKTNHEANGIFNDKFKYDFAGGWNYYLAPGSKGIDAGISINNFADKFDGKAPDLGAAEKGVWDIRVGPHADKK